MDTKTQKALLSLLLSMEETATDIFWNGENNLLHTEREQLSDQDEEQAYYEACLECISELLEVEQTWFDALYIELSERFDRRIKTKLVKNQLRIEEDI